MCQRMNGCASATRLPDLNVCTSYELRHSKNSDATEQLNQNQADDALNDRF